ncbi:MAG: hypothetical protein JW885_11510 [Deltaproteobacteria bacterium]|nr:hypothetical protein [Candidatus Zymogenaceae bacterium]
MSDQYILAVDLGTQSVRAALLSVDAHIIGIEQLPQEVHSPNPGWAQQKPDAWWLKVCGVIKGVLKRSGIDPKQVAGVISCGQMHGPVGLDESGTVTTEWTHIWSDKRCQDQVDHLRSTYEQTVLSSLTGNPPTAGWTGIKVMWLKRHQAKIYDKSRWFLVPKDFINYMLTDVAATDPSEASGTYLWDAGKDTYSQSMAEKLGVDLSKFAPVHKSHEVIGEVTKSAASTTGLAAGTPVMAGGGDFLVSLLGMGMVGTDAAVDITGTVTLFVVHKDEPIVHPTMQNLRYVTGGWVPFVMLDCGGLSVKWCLDLMSSARKKDLSYETLISMAEQAPPGSDGLIFYPYMLGERRPDNTAARGGFFGITINHKAHHFARAVMEGVALAMGMNLMHFRNRQVDIDKVYCVGGGTRNYLLNQIKADVLKLPLYIADEPEATLKGAGLLGAYGLGFIDNIADAAQKCCGYTTIIKPDKKNSRLYERYQENFNRVYEHMVGFYQDT